jgi:two-component system chemotaxis response regulator CheY
MAKNILIVDDSNSVRQMVSLVFKQAGFATLEAGDGREGLAIINSNRAIDLVICDVNMPNMDGIEMVRQVKAKPEHKDLPILMLTTEGEPARIRQAKEAGAAGWIVKPFNASQLVQAARHLTGS